ncbi:hypothetical protein GCM10020331_059120 [Ectobacillus funiculus]
MARSVLEQGGKVTGIIPKKIYENVNHVELTNLIVVEHMHDRKAKMYEMADAFYRVAWRDWYVRGAC